MHVVEDPLENEELRPPQDRPSDQDAHNVRRRENFPGSPDVGFEAVRQSIDFLFQLGEA